MKKRYDNNLCIYCLTEPSTRRGDHIFARSFFQKNKRENVITVPACKSCNEEKSRLEHYLTAVLPFGGKHSDALSSLQEMVPNRLAENLKLHRELANGQGIALIEEPSGLSVPVMTLPFKWDQLEKFLNFVVKGLMWEHWKVVLKAHHSLKVLSLPKSDAAIFLNFLEQRTESHVSSEISNGAFAYEGVQGRDYPELSIWRVSIYGGAGLCGNEIAPTEVSSVFIIITAETQFFQRPSVVAALE